jgi:hypothetical protein
LTETADDSGIARPAALAAQGEPGHGWSSGTYHYDGSGNITAIGAKSFDYDGLSRVRRFVQGALSLTHTYDDFGNLTGLGSATFSYTDNRLNGGTYSAGSRGNLVEFGNLLPSNMSYSGEDRLLTAGLWSYAYDTAGERAAA